MQTEITAIPRPAPPAPPTLTTPRPTPLAWRLGIGVILVVLLFAAYALDEPLGARFRAACGILFFFGVVALFSSNLRAVNWRTIGWGVALQAVLAVLVLKVDAAYEAFKALGEVVLPRGSVSVRTSPHGLS